MKYLITSFIFLLCLGLNLQGGDNNGESPKVPTAREISSLNIPARTQVTKARSVSNLPTGIPTERATVASQPPAESNTLLQAANWIDGSVAWLLNSSAAQEEREVSYQATIDQCKQQVPLFGYPETATEKEEAVTKILAQSASTEKLNLPPKTVTKELLEDPVSDADTVEDEDEDNDEGGEDDDNDDNNEDYKLDGEAITGYPDLLQLACKFRTKMNDAWELVKPYQMPLWEQMLWKKNSQKIYNFS